MNRRLIVSTIALAAAGTILTSATSPAQAGADTTLVFRTQDPHNNTDLDLGKPGPSAGDSQLFLDDMLNGGTRIGELTGICQLTLFTDDRLAGHCVATAVLNTGSLTLQGAFAENPANGPTGFRWAVTGGTGRYRSATGEAIARFVPNSDTVIWTVHLG